MHRPPPGQYRTIATASEPFRAFVPAPLPPLPPVEWTSTLRRRFDDALVALGRLDAVAELLPMPHWCTTASCAGKRCCPRRSFEHGLARLREGFPLSLRLICEMHAMLLDHPLGRGKAAPGNFRRSQVWIGGTHPSKVIV